ncbi:DUF7108 family protein [Natronorubrum daqingense]|uniref:RnhA operon protein n=1 Tax=Natronorubrum daqingense TaxID=588898 RepID=A0A1N7EAL8_9EURY|nr:rnhA operon protein [Natronorubrum daqingense]APX96454.1 rnhA operon protein [Natronorubrum daqingense]SIR85048.1 hypothetical protein SAMN05421809_2569 [Natronorubrum daqingense]
MTDSSEAHADSASDVAADRDEHDRDEDAESDENSELPAGVVDEAERLTRLERSVADDDEARAHATRRETLLTEHDFTSRVREDDGEDVLVLHPDEWHDDQENVIRTDRIDDTSRAVELPLEGTRDPDDWDAVDAHNRTLVEQVRSEYGDVHGDNVASLADFVGNHYAKRIEDLTDEELEEFRTEYFVRNVWPSERQREALEESLEYVYEQGGESTPGPHDR